MSGAYGDRVIVVLRVWIPDRPGALGEIASRIGEVGGDVVAIEVLERGAGQAVDELVVSLPSASLHRALVSAVDELAEVSVEECRVVEDAYADVNLAALTLGVELAEAGDDRLGLLARCAHQLLEASWTAVIRSGELVESVGEVPGPGWISAFVDGSRHLGGDTAREAPSDLVWAPLERSELTLAAGRSGRPVHASERARIELLARLADALLTPPVSVLPRT